MNRYMTWLGQAAAVLLILGGLALMLYPWISSYTYEHGVKSTVNAYQAAAEAEGGEDAERMLQEAEQYNRELSRSQVMLTDPFVEAEDPSEDLRYEEVLDPDGSGIMGFVEIPKIDVYLPVYHGTCAEVLKKGAGHLEGSALPVGGEGTRAVISAHTGINSAKMFTDLTEMEEGDIFFLHVLDRTLAYRVIQTEVIEPEETGTLLAEEGRDLVSLLTCTPYGVNTHRLVVTGERTEYTEAIQDEAAEEAGTGSGSSQWKRAYRQALMIGGGIVLAMEVVRKLIGIYRKHSRSGS